MSQSDSGKEKATEWQINQTFMALIADARMTVFEHRMAALEGRGDSQETSKSLEEIHRQIAEHVNGALAGFADRHPKEATIMAEMLAAWKLKHRI